jgi:type VI secretion system secreted protein VgrG
MPTYMQGERELSITTPLGKDFLLLTGLRGSEAISQLFSFQLDLLAELGTKIQFDKVVGKKATVELRLPTGEKRYFDGLIKRFSQGKRDENFVYFRAELVPKLWLFTKKIRSRIFQQLPVPDILSQVFSGLDVSYKLSATYYNRDYCVQYRESDFDFASRLMEEEGIYYFFDHTSNNHQLVVTDAPTQHPPVSGQLNVTYEELTGGLRDDLRITSWEKTQELRSGEYTLWDHCFELPGKNLEAKEKTIGSVTVGKVTHNLSVGGNDQLEIYDFPGGYAQRFDGVGRSGANQPQNLQDIFRDKERTVRVRMEQEEVSSISITGASNCGHFLPGHRFNLQRHFDADGSYLLTSVQHEARIVGNYRSDQALPFTYENHFACIPLALSYRPPRVTPKPIIAGTQTATVVGPSGEELFCDKYGRIKVQFHWDREGKNDGASSCWVRVAQFWAGKRWGAFFWPRIGHEVVVAFEEGDPDQPLIIGSVYNAENMPPLALPGNNLFAGIKSNSYRGRASEQYNSLLFVDKQGQEHLAIHSERHMILHAEYDVATRSGRHRGERISVAHVVTVGSLPGGGSGGGPEIPGDPTVPYLDPIAFLPDGGGSGGSPSTSPLGAVSGAPWAQPTPQGVFGLSSSMIYGTAFTGSIPLSLQLATGGLLKLVIDPAGFAKANTGPTLPTSQIDPFLSGGCTGNVQLTLGSSSNIVMGQAFDIHCGPATRKMERNDVAPITFALGVVLLVLGLAFHLAYALAGIGAQPATTDSKSGAPDDNTQDDWRAVLIIVFQAAVQILLCSLMINETVQDVAHTAAKEALDNAHGAKSATATATFDLKQLFTTATGYAILAAAITPLVMDAIGESQLDLQSSPPATSSTPPPKKPLPPYAYTQAPNLIPPPKKK